MDARSTHREFAQTAGRFSIGSLIGGGGYGDVYNGRDSTTGESVAIKMEKAGVRSINTFELEETIYKMLNGVVGIPNIRWKGKTTVLGTRVLVFDLLGENLHCLSRYRCNGIFTLKTVAIIADQLLQRLQALHECGYIHRDLKPDNFVMGRGDAAHIVHLIDFGVAAKFPCAGGFSGYVPFASARMHQNEPLSVRDDLESLGYILVFLLTGSLPWLRFKSKAHLPAVLKSKLTAMDTVLAHIHSSFAIYMKYVRSSNNEPVNYAYLRSLFTQIHSPPGSSQAHVFDWELPANVVDQRLRKLTPMYVNPLLPAAPNKGVSAEDIVERVAAAQPSRQPSAADNRASPTSRAFSSMTLGNRPTHCTASVSRARSTVRSELAAPDCGNMVAGKGTRVRSASALTARYARHCRLARCHSVDLLARASVLSRGTENCESADGD